MVVALIVPVMKNFKGFAQLMESVDDTVLPIVVNNWDVNGGVARAWNAGLARAYSAGAEHALVCNDDVVLYPGTIDKLKHAMGTLDLVTAHNMRDDATLQQGFTDHPDYSCFMVKPLDFIDKFGTFDENLFPAYFEDNDMAYRIKILGGAQKCLLEARMFHAGSVTQNMDGMQVVNGPTFEGNRAYYIRKWGGNPGSETFDTPFNAGGNPTMW